MVTGLTQGKNGSNEYRGKELPVVYWDPLRCPHCGSKSFVVYGRQGRNLRYHTCRACKEQFKSIEREDFTQYPEDLATGDVAPTKNPQRKIGSSPMNESAQSADN